MVSTKSVVLGMLYGWGADESASSTGAVELSQVPVGKMWRMGGDRIGFVV